MSTPRFTVIIPAYHRQEFLDEAVNSVLSQSFRDFELFVMDDHSPTPLVVPPDPRITLIRADANAGKSAGINRALERAQGEYVAFLDDDDVWCPHRLAHANKAHQLGPIAVCQQVAMKGGNCSGSAHAPLRVKSQREVARLEMPGSMNTVSVSRAICLPFDPAFRACEDLEWGIRLQQRTSEVVSVDSVDSLWRKHEGTRHGNPRSARILASKELLQLHADHYEAHPQQKAFRLNRIGQMLLASDSPGVAVKFAALSLLTSPTMRSAALVAKSLLEIVRSQTKNTLNYHPKANLLGDE